jgi:hypothetical protein
MGRDGRLEAGGYRLRRRSSAQLTVPTAQRSCTAPADEGGWRGSPVLRRTVSIGIHELHERPRWPGGSGDHHRGGQAARHSRGPRPVPRLLMWSGARGTSTRVPELPRDHRHRGHVRTAGGPGFDAPGAWGGERDDHGSQPPGRVATRRSGSQGFGLGVSAVPSRPKGHTRRSHKPGSDTILVSVAASAATTPVCSAPDASRTQRLNRRGLLRPPLRGLL